MTLKDLEDIGDGGGSSSSSSSGSGSGYPKFNSKVPTFAIWEEDGELVSGWNPQNQFLEYKKEENSSWELHAIPEEMERHWMEKLDLQRTVKMMEEEFNVDGMELLIERPERGLKIARKAAKRHSPQETTWDEESCPVCGEDLHIRYDDYEVIDRRRVCSSHNVAELKEAGLLD